MAAVRTGVQFNSGCSWLDKRLKGQRAVEIDSHCTSYRKLASVTMHLVFVTLSSCRRRTIHTPRSLALAEILLEHYQMKVQCHEFLLSLCEFLWERTQLFLLSFRTCPREITGIEYYSGQQPPKLVAKQVPAMQSRISAGSSICKKLERLREENAEDKMRFLSQLLILYLLMTKVKLVP